MKIPQKWKKATHDELLSILAKRIAGECFGEKKLNKTFDILQQANITEGY